MKRLFAIAVVAGPLLNYARPVPNAALLDRLSAEEEIIGIVHWGLNTYTDREWGYGDENPADLNPANFDADQIVRACADGGLKGLVVVAKHHDGFCLWPTKTTEHNITKSPFRGGKGDYVREMEQACRRAGLKFGVYISPWDRNNAKYGSQDYVTDVFQRQIRELLSGEYGEIFEMWFDGANGGNGYYGGARENRRIAADYYRYSTETFALVRRLQPEIGIFAEEDEAEFRWPGNERGLLSPDSRATVATMGGYSNGKFGNPAYSNNVGNVDGQFFRMCEADFPLRNGWFYHARDSRQVKSSAFLLNRYLTTVGNGGIMNIGIAPNKAGVLDDEDVRALRGFNALKNLLFSAEVKPGSGSPFNVIVMREDISKGELVDGWELKVGGKAVLKGHTIGYKRIRVLDTPTSANDVSVDVSGPFAQSARVSHGLYFADPELLKVALTATTTSGETDTAKWMTGLEKETGVSCPASKNGNGRENAE